MDTLREKLTERVNELPENYLDELGEFIDFLFWKHESGDDTTAEFQQISPQSYQSEKDPLIGLFAGPSDLAEQAEAILEHDAQDHSGWTWKTLPE